MMDRIPEIIQYRIAGVDSDYYFAIENVVKYQDFGDIRCMNEAITKVRAFIAIKLDSAILEKVAFVCEQIQKKVTSRSIRWVKTNQIHLTLRFLGDVPNTQIPFLLEKLKPISKEIAAFKLGLGALGSFPEYRNPRIIWIGLKGDLSSLSQVYQRVAELSAGFGAHAEDKAFKPHLTLARIKEASKMEGQNIGESLQNCPMTATGEWLVERFFLMQSVLTPQGPAYTELGCIPFSKDF